MQYHTQDIYYGQGQKSQLDNTRDLAAHVLICQEGYKQLNNYRNFKRLNRGKSLGHDEIRISFIVDRAEVIASVDCDV